MNEIQVGQVFSTPSGRKLEVRYVTDTTVFFINVERPSDTQRLPRHEFRRIVGI